MAIFGSRNAQESPPLCQPGLGPRRRGRPKDTWRRVALKRLAAAGMKSWREAAVVAQDRCEWKSAGEDVLKALYGESCSAK